MKSLYLLPLSQIYLSWKSGPAEVKHWKDMLARPRTNVAQWHALKAWSHHPASSVAPSRLLSPSFSLSPPPTPVLMHKTDLLPGCETRVQLAICSLKPLKSFYLFFQESQFSLRPRLSSSLLSCSPVLISVSRHFANGSPVSDCLYVRLSVLMHFACGGLIISSFADPLSFELHCSPDPYKVPVPWDHRESSVMI